jgi:putative inorganic carbon (hco3(-)) transporter
MKRINEYGHETELVRIAWALIAMMFAVAFLLNGSDHYATVLAILALVGAVTAAASLQASIVLIAATPGLDSFGILATEPQVLTVFQVVLIASLVGMVYRLARHWHATRMWLTVWDAGILTFLTAAVVSVPLSLHFARSLIGAVEITALVGMYALLSRAEPLDESRRLLCRTLAFVGAVSGLVAIGQAFIPRFPVPLLENHPTGSYLFPQRVSAFFANPNSLALLLVLAATIATERVLRSRTVLGRSAWAATGLVCLLGIALTFSREGFVGLLVGVAAVVLIASPNLRTTLISIFVILALIAGMLAVPGIGERARSIYSFRNDASAMDRQYLSRVSLNMFMDRPVVGIGISAFMSAYPQYEDPRVTISPVTDGHQMPLSIPAETGILGLVAELIMAAFLLCLLPRARALSRSGIDVAGVAAACAFFAMSLFNVLYYAEYLWIALALVASTLRSASLGVLFYTPVGWRWHNAVPCFGSADPLSPERRRNASVKESRRQPHAEMRRTERLAAILEPSFDRAAQPPGNLSAGPHRVWARFAVWRERTK